jgi:hypothetical protein
MASEDKKIRDPLFIIQKIKSGEIDPEKDELSSEERQGCVEALKLEGQTNASIARLFKCDVKTIGRDLKAIWKSKAESPSHETNLILVAEFLEKARANYDSQVRLSNSKEGEHKHRVTAASSAGEALRETVIILQSLGYVPKEALKIHSDVHHHPAVEKTTEQLQKELLDFEKNAAETGRLTPELRERINQLRKRIELNALDREIQNLKMQSDPEGSTNVS